MKRMKRMNRCSRGVFSGGKRAALLTAILSMMLLAAGCGQQEVKETVSIVFFHNNPCESCKEDENFAEIVREELLADKEAFPYEFQVINVFKIEGKEKYEEVLASFGVEKKQAECPLMVIGSRYVSGYKGIKENIGVWVREESLGDAALSAGVAGATGAAGATGGEKENLPDSEDMALNGEGVGDGQQEIRLFTTFSCTECEKVKKKLDTDAIPVPVVEYNISQTDNAQLMMDSFAEWGVPDKEQQVPILFWNGSYASGSEAILKVMEREEWWVALDTASSITRGSSSAWQQELTGKDFLKIIGAGLLNGLNPCGLSMLFLLLSLLTGTESKIGRLGGAYLLGKFLAYLGMGVGLISLFASIEGMMIQTYTVMKFVLLAIAVVLATMNFLDFLHVVRKEYGKIRMQLPAGLRKWNQNMIQKLGSRGGKGLWLVIFLLGIVISAGEFFCTGQIYAATLLMLFQTGSGLRILVLLAIVCYVTALCTPSAICLIVIAKGKSVLAASDKTLQYMPAIKLANGVFFLLFAVFFAFS